MDKDYDRALYMVKLAESRIQFARQIGDENAEEHWERQLAKWMEILDAISTGISHY